MCVIVDMQHGAQFTRCQKQMDIQGNQPQTQQRYMKILSRIMNTMQLWTFFRFSIEQRVQF